MLKIIFFIATASLTITSCNNFNNSKMADNKSSSICSDECRAKNKDGGAIACKLTTPELQKRKETVLASLKAQMTDKKELEKGYAFKFPGTDKVIDELTEFIKTERECCDFFTFNLSISGDKSEAWLELTGAEGVKEFITSELDW